MVLFRALGWLLLAAAIAVFVSDCLTWWSAGAFRLMTVAGLWGRVSPESLRHLQVGVEGLPAGRFWGGVVQPLLGLPALPVTIVGGIVLLWIGRLGGRRSEPSYITGSRPRRRRHSSLS